MKDCILKGLGGKACRGRINQEHPISRSVLKKLGKNNKIMVGGMAKQKPGKIDLRGIDTVTTGIYCEEHNTGLSDLDDTLLAFYDAVIAATKNPKDAARFARISGPQLELVGLKIAVGSLAAKHGRNNVPLPWRQALATRTVEDGWGLYVQDGPIWRSTDSALHTELVMFPIPGRSPGPGLALAIPYALHLHLGPCSITFDLGSPPFVGANGYYRGAGWVIRKERYCSRIALEWPDRVSRHWHEVSWTGPSNVPAPLEARWDFPPMPEER